MPSTIVGKSLDGLSRPMIFKTMRNPLRCHRSLTVCFEHAVLAVEYLHSDAKGPDGAPDHTVTAQLAFEF